MSEAQRGGLSRGACATELTDGRSGCAGHPVRGRAVPRVPNGAMPGRCFPPP